MRHPSLAAMKMPFLGHLAAWLMPLRAPPVLVASLPRAGSSWVGRVLGSAPDALYLREPITQAYLNHVGRRNAPFFEWEMCRDPDAYARFADRAFRGLPAFDSSVIADPGQWSIASRRRRRLVIKDVNPLVLRWLWNRYRPQIVLLLRHPVPVTRSFLTLGWTGDQFGRRFTAATLRREAERGALPREDDMWGQGGAFQAIVQRLTAASLDGVEVVTVRYEDLCSDPLGGFRALFRQLGLHFTDDTASMIEDSSQGGEGYAPGTYDTDRRSAEMAERWKAEVPRYDIERLKAAYMARDPLFYRDDADWS